MMTRNDFELLANALKSEHEYIKRAHSTIKGAADPLEARLQGFSYAVKVVAEVCKANNSRFKPAKFFRACGIDT